MARTARKEMVLVFTAGLSLIAVSSAAAAQKEHECSGEHCEICLHIETARNLLEGLCRGALFCFLAVFAAAPVSAKPALRAAAPPTLVVLKVKSLS